MRQEPECPDTTEGQAVSREVWFRAARGGKGSKREEAATCWRHDQLWRGEIIGSVPAELDSAGCGGP